MAGVCSGIIVAAIVAPIAATLLQMAVSRSREYLADATGARIAGTPVGLANALHRLDEAAHREELHCASEATAHMYIVNPLAGGGLASLFSTHPPMEERDSAVDGNEILGSGRKTFHESEGCKGRDG